ncbi:MAG TPA: NUDIX hydrolase [Candidatus Binataceae bacterium]|nr:NUDIX hydrolase [Candidatus Binataceae bacterium]
MKPRKWKTLHSETVYRTPIFDLERRRAAHPKRGERDFYILGATDWINIIPLTRDRRVVMVRQFRHGIADFTIEIPGGMVDAADASPMHAARREMIEETGYDSNAILALGKVHPNPAIEGNICHSFLARNVTLGCKPAELGAEETVVELVPLANIKRMIASGEIMHALTIAAFSFFHLYNPPPPRR